MVDPDGQSVIGAILIGAAIYGAFNTATNAMAGNVNSFKDGAKAFAGGALVGAAMVGLSAIGIPAPIAKAFTLLRKINTTIAAGSAVVGLVEGIAKNDWQRLENTGKIALGSFYLDNNKSVFGQAWQGISRFTWEAPQTYAGKVYSNFANTFKNVTSVDYFGGATFSSGAGWGGGAVSLGHNIALGNDGESEFGTFGSGVYTFMHEYGHYLQSQEYGLLYLPRIGGNTLSESGWTERDANLRSANYLSNPKNGVNFTSWNPNYYRDILNSPGQAKYSEFPANGKIIRALNFKRR